MHNERDEQVIFIKDLIFTALHQWRKILVVAIAFAMLLGGVKVVSGLASKQQAANAAGAVTEESNANDQATYMEKSVLMNLNPYHIYQATAYINVQAEAIAVPGNAKSASHAGTLLKSYASIVSQQVTEEQTLAIAQLERNYLAELVTVKTELLGVTDGTVIVTVSHYDSQIADDVLEQLMTVLPQAIEELTAQTPHTVTTYTFGQVTMDEELAKAQIATRESLAASQETGISLPGENAGVSTGAILKSGVIFAVIGGILGAFLSVCFIWVAHFSGTKVYSARTLAAWTGVKILACAPAKARRCIIDRYLRKLERRADDAMLPVAAATVRNYQKSGQTLLICADAACPQAALDALKGNAPDVLLHGALTQDVAALEALPTCGSVLLVALCGKTHYSDISRQIQLVRDQNKELLGCIVLDG